MHGECGSFQQFEGTLLCNSPLARWSQPVGMSNGETAVLPHRFHSSFFEFCIALQASVSLFSVDGIPLSNHFKNHFHSVIFLAKIVDEKVQKKDNVGQKLHRKHFLSLIGE